MRCSDVFSIARGMHGHAAAGIDVASLATAPLGGNCYDEFLQSAQILAGSFDDAQPGQCFPMSS